MYNPRHFHSNHPEFLKDLVTQYNFATLIAVVDGLPVISHLPFLYDSTFGTHGLLSAHMARTNPQWRSFKADTKVTVIFQGPHAYVSPRWYAPQPDNVPTWNYAVVHMTGAPRIIQDQDSAFALMGRLVKQHDPRWELSLGAKDRQDLPNEIVVFEIAVTEIDAKFKLSQNRSEGDRKSVIEHLALGPSDLERQTSALMARF